MLGERGRKGEMEYSPVFLVPVVIHTHQSYPAHLHQPHPQTCIHMTSIRHIHTDPVYIWLRVRGGMGGEGVRRNGRGGGEEEWGGRG